MQDFNTPMMQQYIRIKKKYQDCLLFFRMGDFYELFLEDAKIGAEVLDIALTSRAKGKDGRVPMAGVPYHAVDSYLAKLVRAGYKVAICEQLTEPNKQGIVERDVIRIVTPGTVLDEKTLAQKEHNYILCITKKKALFGLALADISTGLFHIHEIADDKKVTALTDELTRMNPTECVLPIALYEDMPFLKMLRKHTNVNIYSVPNSSTYIINAKKLLEGQFGKQLAFNPELKSMHAAQEAAAILVGYLQYTQKNLLPNCKTISHLTDARHMLLDRSTILNLELFSTLRSMEQPGSLIHFLDKTITAMGGRLLRSWAKRPLIDAKEIIARHEGVEELLLQRHQREQMRKLFHEIADIERILSRLSLGLGNARDLVTLRISLEHIMLIKQVCEKMTSSIITKIDKNIDKSVDKVITLIKHHIVDNPPFDTKIGNMIRRTINQELDELHAVLDDNKSWLEEFEKEERKQTGISTLKVRFNKVFGFYIEISKANAQNAPGRYMRKQTLVNGERFITEELKKREELILSGEARIHELEYELFRKILAQVLEYILPIQNAANAIATLDCLLSFAEIAETYHYVKPVLRQDGTINIIDGRHPVVEMVLENNQFVPNNTLLDTTNHQLLVVTGPNMAGKSVYLRQVALITLLNQIGSFVPAKKAELSIVDRIFVRSGASDMISEGLSTFMVEMVETAHILNQATSQSLVIMDEIGRGTSTYDGISIAWAVAEYIVKNTHLHSKTLFATHYHELQDLETKYPEQIKNYHMAVEDEQGDPVFLYTLVSGGASHSFGVAVAKLAGLPDEVIQTAWRLLELLEKRDGTIKKETIAPEKKSKDHRVLSSLKTLDINNLTPIQALTILSEFKQWAK